MLNPNVLEYILIYFVLQSSAYDVRINARPFLTNINSYIPTSPVGVLISRLLQMREVKVEISYDFCY